MLNSSGDEHNDIVTVIVATSVMVLLTSNTFIFVMGCICGHSLHHKCRKLIKGNTSPTNEVAREMTSVSVSGDEQELELEKNVAYGHLQNQNLMETALN